MFQSEESQLWRRNAVLFKKENKREGCLIPVNARCDDGQSLYTVEKLKHALSTYILQPKC